MSHGETVANGTACVIGRAAKAREPISAPQLAAEEVIMCKYV
jgi:hypothetical protein